MSDAIAIEDYNPLWPKLFVEESRRVKSIVGNVWIEHHGSTAVPGLPAKPVIDMMVAISSGTGIALYRLDTIEWNSGWIRTPEEAFRRPEDRKTPATRHDSWWS